MTKLIAYLIDDDNATNFFNNYLLKKSGFFSDWKVFESASDALLALKEEEEIPDLILLDINMPVLSGWDFIDKYELLEVKNKCNCIVMLSTSLNKFDSEKIETRPRVKAYQSKPLNTAVLKDLQQLVIQHSVR